MARASCCRGTRRPAPRAGGPGRRERRRLCASGQAVGSARRTGKRGHTEHLTGWLTHRPGSASASTPVARSPTSSRWTDRPARSSRPRHRRPPKIRPSAVLEGLRRILRLAGAPASAVAAVSHGTTVATNALLEEKFDGLGAGDHRGVPARPRDRAAERAPGLRELLLLGEAGADRAARARARGSRAREPPGRGLRELDEAAAAEVAALVPAAGHLRDRRELPSRLRQSARTSGGCGTCSYASTPRRTVSLSSEVWPEYREYERTVTTLVDAFAKGRVSSYVGTDRRPPGRRAPVRRAIPGDEVQRRGDLGSRGGEPPDHDDPERAGRRRARRRASSPRPPVSSACSPWTRAGPAPTSALVEGGEPGVTTDGAVGRFPVKVPMIDLVTVGTGGGSIAWRAPDGGLRVGPASAGADPGPMCYGRGGTRPTVTDAQLVLGRIPPHLLGGEVPLSPSIWPGRASRLSPRSSASPRSAPPTGIIEIAAWNQANAVEQMSVKRGLDPRDYTLVAFGGSGPLQAGRLVDLLGLRAALIPASPGTVSAFGLLTVDLKNDYVQTAVERHARLDLAVVNGHLARLEAKATDALGREGVPESARRVIRLADLRYFGQAWEVTVELPPGAIDPAGAAETVERFHAAHEKRYGYSYREDQPGPTGTRQGVEWVNLRVVGVGLTGRPEPRASAAGDGHAERARTATRAVRFDGRAVECPVYDRARLQTGDRLAGPAIVEEFGATTVVFPGQRVEVDRFANMILTAAGAAVSAQRLDPARLARSGEVSAGPGGEPDPIVLQIVQGTLASVEAEVEAAIERTARSPMIREARDFRAGIHDRRCRKLTGRSYSSLVQPVVRDFPLSTMRPGDVYFHNDVYESEGGIGHLPDLCVTVPSSIRRGSGRGVRPGIRAPRRHRGRRARLDALSRNERPPGRPDGPAGQALRRGPAEPGRDPDPRAELAASRQPSRRPRQRGLGLPPRRRAARRALPPVWRRAGRGVLRGDPRADDRDVPPGAALPDPRRHPRLGGLRRARRGRPAPAPRAAHHDDQERGSADPRLRGHEPSGPRPDQPRRQLRGRRVPQEVARADPAESRRHAGAHGRAGRQRGRGSPDRASRSRRRVRS